MPLIFRQKSSGMDGVRMLFKAQIQKFVGGVSAIKLPDKLIS